ncbi:major facilitator superfamily domain-containing protein [Aspergillus pseudoustus]|uniref:Major facilitator superfamily domain-containing protein n=1 Tax=Aspergillus pseudoustus TaxID=1810923 RepID=A0ABR4JKX4_9EURO
MLDETHPAQPQSQKDPNTYTLGRILSHNVVIACLPAGIYGTNEAATVVSNMRTTFPNLEYFLMVGVGGGAPSATHDIRLGDVVVSKPTGQYGGVIQYDFGKAVPGESFHLTGMLNQPPQLYGRRILWVTSHIAMVSFLAGSAGSPNIATLLILRFLVGTFGGSPLVNSCGTIAELFGPAQRGLALKIYCAVPFLGHILGPIVGGFVAQSVGWRMVQGVCVILIGVIGVLGILVIPKKYKLVLLQRRGRQLATADKSGGSAAV